MLMQLLPIVGKGVQQSRQCGYLRNGCRAFRVMDANLGVYSDFLDPGTLQGGTLASDACKF
jgi:hypothetical protein